MEAKMIVSRQILQMDDRDWFARAIGKKRERADHRPLDLDVADPMVIGRERSMGFSERGGRYSLHHLREDGGKRTKGRDSN